jgi:hypothetical protein
MKIEIWDKEQKKFVLAEVKGEDYEELLTQFAITESEFLITERINEMVLDRNNVNIEENGIFYKYD